MECVSVGYLIREDNGRKTIAPHLAYPDDEEQCQGNGIMVIPDQAVLLVQRLICPSLEASSGPACEALAHSADHQACGPLLPQ